MSLFSRFFEIKANQIVTVFGHGLVFFLMGFAVLLQMRHTRHGSDLTLSKSIQWLGLFGIVHALADWGLVFIPIQEVWLSKEIVANLQVVQIVLMSFSYALLFRFGTGLATDTFDRWHWLKRAPWVIYAVWLGAYLLFRFRTPLADADLVNRHGLIWAEYSMALIGALCSSWALYLQRREFHLLKLESLSLHLEWLTFALVLFAFAAGVVVPRGSFFPASWINADAFLGFARIPIGALEAISGLVMAIFTVRILEVFDIETGRRLESANRVRAVLDERDRIARDLHDGIIQQLYAVGLSLESCNYVLDNQPSTAGKMIDKIIDRLNGTIQDIRQYVMDLKGAGEHKSLGEQLEEAVKSLDQTLGVPVTFESRPYDATGLSQEDRNHVIQIVREAVSNAARHGRPDKVIVSIADHPAGTQILIRDNGRGFDPRKAPGDGHQGLRNMRRRAQLIQGNLEVESHPGEGTVVSLLIAKEDDA